MQSSEETILSRSTAVEFVRTSPYAMRRTHYAVKLLGTAGRITLVCCLVPAVVAAVFAFYDLRFLILALMILMIVMPLMLGFLYIANGIMPESALNVVTHTVEFRPEGLRVELLIEEMPPLNPVDPAETEVPPVVKRTIEIPAADIKGWDTDSRSMTLRLARPKRGFVYIPFSAFGETEALRSAVEVMRGYIVAK